jgi:hypothetical protein
MDHPDKFFIFLMHLAMEDNIVMAGIAILMDHLKV